MITCPKCLGIKTREIFHDDSKIVKGEVDCDECNGVGEIPDEDDCDEDNFCPCDDCDLPDACADFGCAIKQGLRNPTHW